MRDMLHLLIILWIIMAISSAMGRPWRRRRIFWEMADEHKSFQEQVLTQLQRQTEATEKQNEILNQILQRMGGTTPSAGSTTTSNGEPLPPEE